MTKPTHIFIAALAFGLAAQNVTAAPRTLAEQNALFAQKVGKTLWLHHKCSLFRVYENPAATGLSDHNWNYEAPFQFTIEAFELRDGDGSSFRPSSVYKLTRADGQVRYVPAFDFNHERIAEDVTAARYGQSSCLAAYSPDERVEFVERAKQKEEKEIQERAAALEKEFDDLKAAADALAKKPPVRIGMTAKQVRTASNWGSPRRINRTISARGNEEQWVYGAGYLYFKNGVLVTIQTF